MLFSPDICLPPGGAVEALFHHPCCGSLPDSAARHFKRNPYSRRGR